MFFQYKYTLNFCPHAGEFDDGFRPHGGNLTKIFSKSQIPGGSPRGARVHSVHKSSEISGVELYSSWRNGVQMYNR
jgi:hypothetical protein